MRILLIEDDPIVSSLVKEALQTHHYAVEIVSDGQEGLSFALSNCFDLIVLDINLPSKDGITICQSVRSNGILTPILLMTAREASMDRVRGLDAGADDYLVKPINVDELLARVRALLRRQSETKSPVLEAGDLTLDSRSCEVRYHQALVALTPKEFSLLELMMRSPNRVFSRGEILEHLWTFDAPPLEDSVKAHVKGLRAKLKKVGIIGWLDNVYGVGYRFVPKIKPNPSPTKENSQATIRPAPQASSEMELRMHQLWEKYQGVMGERLQILQATSIAIESQQLDEMQRVKAAQAAHKLAGVLGSFDRDLGTQIARDLEEIFETQTSFYGALGERVCHLIQELTTQMHQSPNTPENIPTFEERYLLINGPRDLATELNALAHTHQTSWRCCPNLKQAKAWLKNHSPDGIVINLTETLAREQVLSFIHFLSAEDEAPEIIVLVSQSTVEADGEDIINFRHQISQFDQTLILSKPVTAITLWDQLFQVQNPVPPSQGSLLLVDDDPVFLDMMRSLLIPWGMTVATLTDPRQLLTSLQTLEVDLLILDIDMPHLTGLELCRAVRAELQWQHLPILFVTAKRDRKIIHQGFLAGADDYITKPIVESELLTRITHRLERGQFLRLLRTQDPITTLSNYSESCRQMELLLSKHSYPRPSLKAWLFRISQLNLINQQQGHTIGQQVLKRFAHMLRNELPKHAITGYWGNGDFLVMKSEAKPDKDLSTANLCRQARKLMYSSVDGKRLQADVLWAEQTDFSPQETTRSLYARLVSQLKPV